MYRRHLAFAAAVLACGSLALGLAAPASATPLPMAARANLSPSEFIDRIERIQPSLRDQYSDRDLVKLGRNYCKALKAGASVARIDKITRGYLTAEEAEALIGLSVSAFCDRYRPRVQNFYGLEG